MVRIDLTRQNTNRPDRRKRHPSRASCEVAGRRFEAQGSAPIYKLATLLWLHGYGGADFEVYDDRSPTGRPGGLAMRGRVRNWARLVNGKVTFDRQAQPEAEFTSDETDLIARAAGTVSDAAKIDSPAPGNARTGATRPLDGPGHQPEPERPSMGVSTAQAS